MSLLMASRAAFIRSSGVSGGAISLVDHAVNSIENLTSVTVSATPDGSNNQVLLVMIQNYAGGSTPSVTSVLANSISMTLIGGTSADHMWMYYLLLGSSSTVQSVVVTMAPVSQDVVAHASIWSNVVQTVGAVFAHDIATGAASTVPTYSATGVNPASIAVAHVLTGTSRYGTVDGTELYELNWSATGGTAGAKGSGAAYMSSAGTTLTMSFQNVGVGVTWTSQGVCLRAA